MSVSSTIARARALDEGAPLLPSKRVLSSNQVCGWSVNLPIYRTCKPSKVCVESCYAGLNTPIALPAALTKQVGLLNAMREDPHAVAVRIVKEMRPLMRRGVKFLRWNGVGDLFDESIECLVAVAQALPDLALWVVTRIPAQAARVPDLDNVYVHFSLDRSSLGRREELRALAPLSSRIFYSYTEAPGEVAPPDELHTIEISVYFTDLYKRAAPPEYQAVSCELNRAHSIKDGCISCGRCWSDKALDIAQSVDKQGT